MPLLIIRSNAELAPDARTDLLKQASGTLAEILGKPERYVMVELVHNPDMLFGGEPAPLAYLELKSIGLPEQRTAEISAALCKLIGDRLGVATDRIYIEFSNAARHLWGWNGATF
jgi:phenylpyruvate tautomerase PptA (4-oxalocrotonate tautomerase family)